ncbi:hypothetical protein QZH41_006140 [Actinostola sp. cb2023]|nr:hypothetical protein QZH41_006140 [Actinostola sp. cb2023]
MAQYPVLKSDKPIVHVVNGCCGWNSIAFKKSLISEEKKKIEKSNKVFNRKKDKLKSRKLNGRTERRISKTLRFNIALKMPAHKKTSLIKNFKILSARQNSMAQRKPGSKRHYSYKETSVPPFGNRQPTNDIKATKKSSFQSGETGFQVTGTAGKLNMDVTRTGTKLSSESGAVDVFLKQKAKPASRLNDIVRGSNRHVVHVAPELISGGFDDVALRKSEVPWKRHRPKTRGLLW